LELTSTTSAPERATPDAGGRRRRAISGWVVASGAIAFLFVAPLLALPASFFRDGFGLERIARLVLPEAFRTSLVLAAGVGVGTLLVGGGLALLVSFYDFPGRRWLDWALVLPMAMPGYVLVFVILGQYGVGSPLQSSLFSGLEIPGIRTTTGGIAILTAVLYPYVYVLGRSAFLGQSRQTLEVARSLGRSYGQSVWHVALPLARPALAGGVALAVMEALADFGTVNLLGIQALTNAIYRVWNGAFNEAAGLQLATVLLTLTLVLVTIERLLRGRARYNQSLARGDAVIPKRLTGWRGLLAAAPGCLLLVVVFELPVAQLVAWSLETINDGTTVPNLGSAARNTALLGAVTALVAPVIAMVMV
jgi:iron(III) transport system permease protein